MTNDKNLRNELLKQDGLQADTLSDEDREALRRILKRDRARVRWMKWITGVAWALLLASWAGAYAVNPLSSVAPYFMVGVPLWYALAIVCTFSLIIRSWALHNREFQFHFVEIEAHLQRIEEAIKLLSAGK